MNNILKKTMLLITALGLLGLLFSCSDLNEKGGVLSITMPETSRYTAEDVSYYELSVYKVVDFSNYENGSSQEDWAKLEQDRTVLEGEKLSPGQSRSLELDPGDYSISIEAFNSSGVYIGGGEDSVTVTTGHTSNAQIEIELLTENNNNSESGEEGGSSSGDTIDDSSNDTTDETDSTKTVTLPIKLAILNSSGGTEMPNGVEAVSISFYCEPMDSAAEEKTSDDVFTATYTELFGLKEIKALTIEKDSIYLVAMGAYEKSSSSTLYSYSLSSYVLSDSNGTIYRYDIDSSTAYPSKYELLKNAKSITNLDYTIMLKSRGNSSVISPVLITTPTLTITQNNVQSGYIDLDTDEDIIIKLYNYPITESTSMQFYVNGCLLSSSSFEPAMFSASSDSLYTATFSTADFVELISPFCWTYFNINSKNTFMLLFFEGENKNIRGSAACSLSVLQKEDYELYVTCETNSSDNSRIITLSAKSLTEAADDISETLLCSDDTVITWYINGTVVNEESYPDITETTSDVTTAGLNTLLNASPKSLTRTITNTVYDSVVRAENGSVILSVKVENPSYNSKTSSAVLNL